MASRHAPVTGSASADPHDLRARRLHHRRAASRRQRFLLKDAPTHDVLAAVRAVAAGDAVLSAAVTASCWIRSGAAYPPPCPATPRIGRSHRPRRRGSSGCSPPASPTPRSPPPWSSPRPRSSRTLTDTRQARPARPRPGRDLRLTRPASSRPRDGRVTRKPQAMLRVRRRCRIARGRNRGKHGFATSHHCG